MPHVDSMSESIRKMSDVLNDDSSDTAVPILDSWKVKKIKNVCDQIRKKLKEVWEDMQDLKKMLTKNVKY